MKARNQNEQSKSKLQTWAERILAGLFLGPIILAILVGLFSVVIKFIQICVAWVS